MKAKHKILNLIMAVLLVIPATFFLTACGDDGDKGSGGNSNLHDSSKWFTETELAANLATGTRNGEQDT